MKVAGACLSFLVIAPSDARPGWYPACKCDRSGRIVGLDLRSWKLAPPTQTESHPDMTAAEHNQFARREVRLLGLAMSGDG